MGDVIAEKAYDAIEGGFDAEKACDVGDGV